jgi:hypothetical protein
MVYFYVLIVLGGMALVVFLMVLIFVLVIPHRLIPNLLRQMKMAEM